MPTESATNTAGTVMTTLSEQITKESNATTMMQSNEITTQKVQAVTTGAVEKNTSATNTTETNNATNTDKEYTSGSPVNSTKSNTGARMMTTETTSVMPNKQLTEKLTTQKESLETTSVKSSSLKKKCICDNSEGWFKDGDTCSEFSNCSIKFFNKN